MQAWQDIKIAVLSRISAAPLRILKWLFSVAALVLVLYLPVGMLIVSTIDDDVNYAVSDPPQGASRAVEIAAALTEREARRWTPNDPFFLPGAWLDRMPNFQKGIIAAVSRFAVELTDQLGRTRGSSQSDPDLEKALGHLKAQPEIWVFDFSTSILPTTSSNTRYVSGAGALRQYNQRVAKGQAAYEIRADNLLGTLDRIAADLGSASAALAEHIHVHRGFGIDTQADVVFYDVKGRAYAYYLILRELGKDYAPIIAERQLGHAWQQMIESLATAAGLRPFWVLNVDPGSELFANHPATLGFYLLRGRTQMREVTNILAK